MQYFREINKIFLVLCLLFHGRPLDEAPISAKIPLTSEEEKNRLMDEVLKQASLMADQLINRLSSEIEKSARQTMETLTKGFGAKSVTVDFSKSKMVERSVTDVYPQGIAEAKL